MSFNTGRELWLDVMEQCLRGKLKTSRDGDQHEVQGVSWRLNDPEASWIDDANRKATLRYACAELIWYLSGTKDGWIRHYAPQYERFLEKDGSAHGAYGYRWMLTGQIGFVLRELGTRPNTRRAIMTMWDPQMDIAQAEVDGPDVPCTLSLQFIREGDLLNLVATMRSNDAWLGLPYDMFCFTTMQRLIAGALGLRLGWYTHQVGSMHLYDRNVSRAGVCLRRHETLGERRPLSGEIPSSPVRMLDECGAAVLIEMKHRAFGLDMLNTLPNNSLLRQVAAYTMRTK